MHMFESQIIVKYRQWNKTDEDWISGVYVFGIRCIRDVLHAKVIFELSAQVCTWKMSIAGQNGFELGASWVCVECTCSSDLPHIKVIQGPFGVQWNPGLSGFILYKQQNAKQLYYSTVHLGRIFVNPHAHIATISRPFICPAAVENSWKIWGYICNALELMVAY